METYPMEGMCGYWIGEGNDDDHEANFISIYLVFDSEKMGERLNRAVEVNRKRNSLKSTLENMFGAHVYVGSTSQKCEDDKVINESIPLKFRRRIPAEIMKSDIKSIIYDFKPCQFTSAGEFIAEACDSLKDYYISYFEFNDSDVTPKDKDDLYYALVDMHGAFLSKIYYNRCGDTKKSKIRYEHRKKIKHIIRENHYKLLRRITEIEKEVDKVLKQISNQNSISELTALPLENLILIVSSYVAIEIADKANIQGEGDDYITLRNQVKQYVKNNFYDEIKSYLDKIKQNN